jgi:hypothetical protein
MTPEENPATEIVGPTETEVSSASPEATIVPPPVKKVAPRAKPEPKPREILDIEVARKMIKIYQSAVDRKLEFNLSFATVKKLLSYKTCYYTNREFVEDRENSPFARSFDRIDSNKGYVEGNVVACTVDINGKKSNLSLEEIETLYNKLVLKK